MNNNKKTVMEEQKTIPSKELMKDIDKQTPKIKNDIHNFLDSLLENGNYHIIAITRAVAGVADDFGVGYDEGRKAGRLLMLDSIIKSLEQLRDFVIKEDEEDDHSQPEHQE